MNRWRKALYILSWLPVIAVKLVLILLGLVAVPLMLAIHDVDGKWPSRGDWLWLWGNDEEGCPDWWLRMAETKGGFIARVPRWWWFAVRNPVGNHRFLLRDREAAYSGNWATRDMEAQDLIRAGITSAWRWAYNGVFAGYRKVWLSGDTYSEFWIGWKVGSRVPGMGFALQWRLNREIGT